MSTGVGHRSILSVMPMELGTAALETGTVANAPSEESRSIIQTQDPLVAWNLDVLALAHRPSSHA